MGTGPSHIGMQAWMYSSLPRSVCLSAKEQFGQQCRVVVILKNAQWDLAECKISGLQSVFMNIDIMMQLPALKGPRGPYYSAL